MWQLSASPALNVRLSAELVAITAATRATLGENLEALILGGGYGRGEGGVVNVDGIDAPYNDLDLTIVVRQKPHDLSEVLHALAHPCSARLGIDVEYSRPLTVHDIRYWPAWLVWHDLLNGHIVLDGPADILTANAPASVKAPPPAIEGTRLLLNRGAGLLWAMRVARGLDPAPDPDFIRRNYYKCQLALGDALLILTRRYATPYIGRDARVAAMAAAEPAIAAFDLLDRYADALAFKFRPDAVPVGDITLDDLHACSIQWGKVFLYLEAQRCCHAWPSLDAYAHWHGVREPAQHQWRVLPRNVALNLRRGALSWRYPREQLYRTLPDLLTHPEEMRWEHDSAACLSHWKTFN